MTIERGDGSKNSTLQVGDVFWWRNTFLALPMVDIHCNIITMLSAEQIQYLSADD